MNDVLKTLERWAVDGVPAVTATVVSVERSAPRGPGATMALSREGEIAGSVTGGCVEPAVIACAEEVLAGGPARVLDFGFADEEAFEVGLPCGGSVRILVAPMDAVLIRELAAEVRRDGRVALVADLAGPGVGTIRLARVGEGDPAVGDRLERADSGMVGDGDDLRLVVAFAPRPRMYVFGAIDFASSLTRMGRFLGYHVTVCDARSAFVTRERFPDADEIVVGWPHELIERASIDSRSAICILTHDSKFDVPALLAALRTPAGYVGAMGSRRTTERRVERLRESGLGDAELARIHAPIGLSIGAKRPEEVAVAIAAQIVQSTREAATRATPTEVRA